jgi:hypothetical protein
MIQHIQRKNPILFWLGTAHYILFALLLGYAMFNESNVLGINSMFKPMKFALSIWMYAWTMALILPHITDANKVKNYTWAAVISMSFEQFAITSQAFRGELSHFNRSSPYGIILFTLMGVFILAITLWTGYMTYLFFRQKKYDLPPSIVLSIKLGLIYFVVFSLFGGYISSLTGHTVGAVDGGKGLFFINWSTFFGDLRVAHFFGIHSLQIIPLFGIFAEYFFKKSTLLVWAFSLIYLCFVLFTMQQGLRGIPFI